jgi:hypothetical protein
MSSRRSVRQLLVAVLLGVLVGGGLMAVTPAGAEVAQAAATSWKKIWKKELKPLADKRYYQKSQSDTKYASKAEAAAAAAAAQSAATSASNSATDSKLGGYYKKTETDAKYAPSGATVRGSFMLLAGPDGNATSPITFGQGFSAAPTVRYISIGEPVPAGCSGSAAAPNAAPGFLCVFESYNSTVNVYMCSSVSTAVCSSETADAYGTTLYLSAAGVEEVNGTWAARPLAPAAFTLPKAPQQQPSVPSGGRIPALQ